MQERYSPHNPRQVRNLNERQYESIWDSNAQKRRELYKYEVMPGENRKPYNIWEDMAKHLDLEKAATVVDLGSNDGYFLQILKNRNFSGQYIGVEVEGVQELTQYLYGDPDTVQFIEGDATNLQGIIPENFTDRVIAANLIYHVDKPRRLFSEVYRILKPGGLAVFSSRDVGNQKDTWEQARQIGHNFGFGFHREIRPNDKGQRTLVPTRIEDIIVYSHFDTSALLRSLRESKRFKVSYESTVMRRPLWIPAQPVGISDYQDAVESLFHYMEDIKTGRKLTEADLDEVRPYLHQYIESFIQSNGVRNQQEYDLPFPCHISQSVQGFVVVEAIKNERATLAASDSSLAG
jgi:SAM-dependent methyltransferase